MAVAFMTAGGVFVVLACLLLVRHEPELGGVANGIASVFLLISGIVGHFGLVIALSAVSLAFNLIGWGGPRRRRRVKRVLGNKSRQLRASLMRRMRQRRVKRPGWSPSPAPSS